MLPDEIVSEILSPALKVSDHLFCDTSDVSPFATYSPSTSAYLLVCKDWLRVATPLLYHVVVLRSKAQANALEKVMRSSPEFGRYIKKLRVEGGYGTAMHTILKSAPNITDLFFSLSIWSSDNTTGLCKGLPLINPRRVIVVDPWTYKPLQNKHLTALAQTMLSCIRTWDNLVLRGFQNFLRTLLTFV
jgi:F-box-like